jgi:WD40 repeat protein
MKTKKNWLPQLTILVGIIALIGGGYVLARLLPTSVPGLPPLSSLDLSSQTQNGYTATIASYYADASRLVFQIHITGGDGYIGSANLFDENGDFINASTGFGPAGSLDSSFSQIEFATETPLPGDQLKGQLVFSYTNSPGEGEKLADFKFDLDIPIHPALTFEPKQSYVSVSGMNILLDRVVITPAYTQAYLCYVKPTDADWMVSSETTLKIGNQQARLSTYALLFDPAFFAGDKGGEMDWVSPVRDGRCVKIGFPIGDENPQSITLTIPALEQSMPEVIPADQLAEALKQLKDWDEIDMEWHIVDHGAYPEYKKLPPGMTEQQAFHKFIEALGYVYYGQWKFDVLLNPQESSAPTFSTSTYGMATPIPLSSNKPQIIATLPGIIHSFDISPDKKTIAIATSQGVFLYDLNSHERLREIGQPKNVSSIAWSPNGARLAIGGVDSAFGESGMLHLTIWDTSAWKVVSEPEISKENWALEYGALAWSADSTLLATAAYERGVIILNVQTGEVVSQQTGFIVNPYGIAWSPDGSRIVVTGDLGYGIRRWRLATGESIRLYDQRGDAAKQVMWLPDGKRIVSGHQNGTVCFWTVATNQCDGLIKAHENLYGLALTSDGKQIATSGTAIRIWDAKTGKMVKAFGIEANDSSFLSRYTQLAWPASDFPLISLEEIYRMGDDAEQIIRFWDVATGQILFEFHGASGVFGQ